MYTLRSIDGYIPVHSKKFSRMATLGYVCELASRRHPDKSSALRPFISCASSAIDLSQIKVYFNGYEQCVAFVIWARISENLEREYLGGRFRYPTLNEWNEGNRLWVIDFCAETGCIAQILGDLRDSVFSQIDRVRYFRVKGRLRMAKEINSTDKTTFMRSYCGSRSTASL